MKTIIVGLRGIGKHHAESLSKLPEFSVQGFVDLNVPLAEEMANQYRGKAFGDFDQALEQVKPDVVVVATPNDSHARLTLRAAEFGVRGIFCEKPMAVHLADARKMVAVCAERGTKLVVNHQRRMLPVFREMRRMMDEGSLGKISLIRASCAGDFLSDGTHLVDTLRFLAGDAEVEWVAGSVFVSPKEESEKGSGFDAKGGYRFGHPVEDAAQGVFQFSNGIRAEFSTGNLFPEGRWYQDYEVFGDQGRLWRKSDSLEPPLQIQDGQPGGYRPVPIETPADHALEKYRLFAEMIERGVPHPLDGASGLKDMELVTAVYESARRRDRVTLPLESERFPLEAILEERR